MTTTSFTTPATFNTLWADSVGRTVQIDGETRTVVSRRACGLASLELKLDRPLEGNTSPLFTVDFANIDTVSFVETVEAWTVEQVRTSAATLRKATLLEEGDRIIDTHRMTAPIVTKVERGVGLRGGRGTFVRVSFSDDRTMTVGRNASFKVAI